MSRSSRVAGGISTPRSTDFRTGCTRARVSWVAPTSSARCAPREGLRTGILAVNGAGNLSSFGARDGQREAARTFRRSSASGKWSSTAFTGKVTWLDELFDGLGDFLGRGRLRDRARDLREMPTSTARSSHARRPAACRCSTCGGTEGRAAAACAQVEAFVDVARAVARVASSGSAPPGPARPRVRHRDDARTRRHPRDGRRRGRRGRTALARLPSRHGGGLLRARRRRVRRSSA